MRTHIIDHAPSKNSRDPEKQIDKLVYRLFDITPAEQKIIEKK